MVNVEAGKVYVQRNGQLWGPAVPVQDGYYYPWTEANQSMESGGRTANGKFYAIVQGDHHCDLVSEFVQKEDVDWEHVARDLYKNLVALSVVADLKIEDNALRIQLYNAVFKPMVKHYETTFEQ